MTANLTNKARSVEHWRAFLLISPHVAAALDAHPE